VLYGPVIHERFRRPRFRGRLADPDRAFEDVNPLCGDRIRIECRLADGRLAEVRHSGDSCAIAQASADVLLEMVQGRPVETAAAVTPGALLERLAAEIRPSRLKCVTLPLQVLQAAVGCCEARR
jgi:nitrogen fixation NifU-like protein